MISMRQRKFFVEWLGIPEEECPPNHYRMLGLPLCEPDVAKIRLAIQQRRVLVHSKAGEEDRATAVAIQKFLITVEGLLIDPAKKLAYDRKLESQSNGYQKPHNLVTGPSQRTTEHVSVPAAETVAESLASSAVRNDPPSSAKVSQPDAMMRVDGAETPSASNARTISEQPDPDATPTVESQTKTRYRELRSPLVIALVTTNLLMMLMMGSLLLYLWQTRTVPAAHTLATTTQPEPTPPPPLESGSPDFIAEEIPESATTEPTTQDVAREPAPSSPREEEIANVEIDSKEVVQETAQAISDGPVDSDPFSELVGAVDLPEIPAVYSEISESVSAGKIAANAVRELSVELDSSATSFVRFYEFRTKELNEDVKGLRSWQVLAVPTGNQTDDPVQLGVFVIDELNQFRFLWQMNRPFPKKNAAQLSNALLVLKSGVSRHVMQLRGVRHRERYRTQLFKKTLPIPLALKDPPNDQQLMLRVVDLRGVEARKAADMRNTAMRPSRRQNFSPNSAPQGKSDLIGFDEADENLEVSGFGVDEDAFVEDAGLDEAEADFEVVTRELTAPSGNSWKLEVPVGGPKELEVDGQGRVGLSIQFAREERDAEMYKFGVAAKAEKREGGNRVNVTVKELQSEINRQQKVSLELVKDNIVAYNSLAAAQAKLPAARTRLESLRQQALANPRSAPGLQKSLQQANEAVVFLQNTVNKSTSLLNLTNKNIPTSFKAFARKVAIARILSDIHSRGEIEFQLFAKAESGTLLLLAADGQPEAAKVEVIIPPFSLPGRWFRVSNRTVYQLFDNGGLTVTDTMGRVPDMQGLWRQEGDQVIFEADGGREQYRLHEDVMMESATGSLYRFD